MNNRTPKRYYSDGPLVDRYQPRTFDTDDECRDAHTFVKDAERHDTWPVGAGPGRSRR